MRPGLREKFTGLYAGLAVVAAFGIFWFVLHVGGAAYQKHQEKSDLSSWSLARILEELGQYDQRIPDCLGLVQGMNGYAYAKVDPFTGQLKGVIIVCK